MAEPGPPIATLLVADDDPAVRQSLERTLTREGYAVVLTGNQATKFITARVTGLSPTQNRILRETSPPDRQPGRRAQPATGRELDARED